MIMLEESHQFQDIDEIPQILKEGRKFGLGMGLITQTPSRIREESLSQIGSYAVFRTTNAADVGIIQQLLPDHFLTSIPRIPVLQTGEMMIKRKIMTITDIVLVWIFSLRNTAQ